MKKQRNGPRTTANIDAAEAVTVSSHGFTQFIMSVARQLLSRIITRSLRGCFREILGTSWPAAWTAWRPCCSNLLPIIQAMLESVTPAPLVLINVWENRICNNEGADAHFDCLHASIGGGVSESFDLNIPGLGYLGVKNHN